jgi:hypothetical protein
MANWPRLELHQVDIKSAYLNGVLNKDEVLYRPHAASFWLQGGPRKNTCAFLWSFYVLKKVKTH